ncbi:MAG: TonB-dependent siderophore receptor [Gammaproteobacteria bacterium]
MKVFFSSDKARNLKTAGVNGNFTPTQALNRLLAESGLHYRYTQADAVTIEPKPASDPKDADIGGAETLQAVSVSGAAEFDAADPYNPGYQWLRSRSATKTDTPILETPFSVQVVPRAQPTMGAGGGFIIRGFRTGNIYRNGLLTNEGGFGDFDAGNLDGIEVLKGPAQLYGRTEPGGLIAITTQRPLDMPYYSLEQQFGSYDYYRTQWDAGGPVTGDKKLLYRFSGAYQSNNSFRDFVSADRKLFNPSITWRPTEATDIIVDIEGTEKFATADFGIPVIGKRPAPIPISRNLGDPNTPIGDQTTVKVASEINHHFNGRLSGGAADRDRFAPAGVLMAAPTQQSALCPCAVSDVRRSPI